MTPVVDSPARHDVHLLADDLAKRLDGTPQRILYLSRNDLEPGRAIQDRFPGALVTIWSKADFQGLKASDVLRKLRRESYDVFAFHDRPVFSRRLSDLYRLVASVVRARRRFLIAADLHRGELAGSWTIDEVHPVAGFPKLAGRLLLELVASSFLLLYTPLALAGGEKRGATRFRKKDRYRIAFLRTEPSVDLKAGGSVSHIAGVAGGMKAAGHEVFFVSSEALPGMERIGPVEPIPPGDTIRVFDEAALVAYHHRFVGEGAKILERMKPDLIYQRHSVFSAAGAVLARRFGIPLVLEANNSETKVRMMWSRLQLKSLAEEMEREAFRGAEVIVAVSEIGKKQIVEYGADPGRVLVNPNGVDPELFHPEVDGSSVRRRYNLAPDDLVCGFLGTFTRWHGVLFLADAIRPLASQFPSFRVLFMGDGDLRSAVEEKVERSGLSDRCVFTGLIGHDQVPPHLAACDILVAAHLPFEDGTPFFGSPTKLFEYMAMGRTVVASNLGQIGDVIVEGESGLLFRPGSEPEFVTAMTRALQDPGLRARLGQGARRRAIESYTWEQNVNRVFHFLESRSAGTETKR